MGFFIDPIWDWMATILFFMIVFGLALALRFKRTVIREDERAFHFRDGKFVGIKGPGAYWTTARDEFDVEIITELAVKSIRAEIIMAGALDRHRDQLDRFIMRVDVPAGHVGLARLDGHLWTILRPDAIYLFWRTGRQIDIQLIDARARPRADAEVLAMVRNHPRAGEFYDRLAMTIVPEGHATLLLVNGVAIEALPPGQHGYWRADDNIELRVMPIATRSLSVSGQDIMTSDRVAVRVNLLVLFSIPDPLRLTRVTGLNHYDSRLYELSQLALRRAVGRRSLDALLDGRDGLEGEIRDELHATFANMGVALEMVGLKDVILPGEVRAIMNKVIEAERSAQANLIRRREETAAMRSQLNTAKMMEDNPMLVRLKELEALEKVMEKVDSLTLSSGVEGLLRGFIKIQDKD